MNVFRGSNEIWSSESVDVPGTACSGFGILGLTNHSPDDGDALLLPLFCMWVGWLLVEDVVGVCEYHMLDGCWYGRAESWLEESSWFRGSITRQQWLDDTTSQQQKPSIYKCKPELMWNYII